MLDAALVAEERRRSQRRLLRGQPPRYEVATERHAVAPLGKSRIARRIGKAGDMPLGFALVGSWMPAQPLASRARIDTFVDAVAAASLNHVAHVPSPRSALRGREGSVGAGFR